MDAELSPVPDVETGSAVIEVRPAGPEGDGR
jgi:hypothetical protein